MKDELFTMTPEMPTMSPEILARWQEEMRRNALRIARPDASSVVAQFAIGA